MFEQRFDLIVVEGGLAVLNQNSFELLFRETRVLASRAPEWVQALAEVLPFEDGAEQQLTEACLRDYRLLRRLRSIQERAISQTCRWNGSRKRFAGRGSTKIN